MQQSYQEEKYFPRQTKAKGVHHHYTKLRASLVAQTVKNPPAMQETPVQSLGQEDPLENEVATHSSILAWRIPRTEELGGLKSTGRKESDTTKRLHFSLS